MTNLQKFLFYVSDLESPELFLKWTCLWTISSALQRRIYWGDPNQPVFPNMFVVFVADPGIGKSLAANIAGSRILKTFYKADAKQIIDGEPLLIPEISFSADATSPESLIEQLSQSIRSYHADVYKDGVLIGKAPRSHNSLCMLLSEELVTLFRKNMDDLAGYLCQWWDARDFEYRILSRNVGKIKNVCVSLLGCTTPRNMRKLMATGILDQGLTARMLCIFEDKTRHRRLEFKFGEEQNMMFEDVRNHVKELLKIEGQVKFSTEAEEWFKDYYESGKLQGECANDDIRLQDYIGRLKVHVIKTAINLHFMENIQSKIIELSTVKMAVSWLREIEMNMHKALASSSKNPLYDVSMNILNYLQTYGPKNRIQLKMVFEMDVDGDDLNKCLRFLQEGQLITCEGQKFHATKKQDKPKMTVDDILKRI